jgi:hypothetical protein
MVFTLYLYFQHLLYLITDTSFFLMSCQVKTSGQWHLRDKKHQYFSFVSLPTDSVIVDHAVLWRPKNFGRHFLDIQVKCK